MDLPEQYSQDMNDIINHLESKKVVNRPSINKRVKRTFKPSIFSEYSNMDPSANN